MARVVLISAFDRPVYELGDDVFSMGRLPNNNICLTDALASRRHAEIRKDGDHYLVVDLGSLNGVYVNNLKISEERLAHGDVIVIGECRLLFEDCPEGQKVNHGSVLSTSTLPEDVAPFEPTPAPGLMAGLPGFARPEIVKPLFKTEPNFEIRDLASLDSMKPLPVVSGPDKIESVRSRNFYILYQVARALNSTNSLSELLDQTMTLIFQVIKAERGVIFLYDSDGQLAPVISMNREEGGLPELTVSRTITERAIREKAAIITADAKYDPRFQAGASIVAYNIRSAICVPLWEKGRIRGAIYLDNLMETYAFSEDDLDLLTAIANQVAIAVQHEEMQEKMREHAVLRANLERFHSPDVANMIMQQSRLEDGITNQMEEREVTVIFADICNFTPLMERIPHQEAADLLIEYFDTMTAIVFNYKGTVDKFIGDAIMAIFGAPISHDNDVEQAVLSAIEMMHSTMKFNLGLDDNKKFDIRIGVNTGVVISGYLGSKIRLEYTVLGDPVNVAARLQGIAAPGTILVGEDTYEAVKNIFNFHDKGSRLLKGKKEETGIYEVVI